AQLPEPDFGRLLKFLAETTGTPDRIWLLVWDGYGMQFEHPPGSAFEVSTSLTGSGRRYRLHRGRMESGEGMKDGPPHDEPPNFWWPEDRAWIVSTDIDGTSTYVGGSTTLIDRILADEELEAFPADLDDTLEGNPYW